MCASGAALSLGLIGTAVLSRDSKGPKRCIVLSISRSLVSLEQIIRQKKRAPESWLPEDGSSEELLGRRKPMAQL